MPTQTILVMMQDAAVSELNQQGLHARRFKQGVLMPEEHNVKSFHHWKKKRLRINFLVISPSLDSPSQICRGQSTQ
jgi:hypothetical protein